MARRDGWLLETEPPRSRIDTWARACVPIRKVFRKDERKNERSSAPPVKRSGSRASYGSVSIPGSRSPSRFGAHTVAETETSAPKPIRNQQIPLVDEREARKMRDDQVRSERKAAEAEEAKMSQRTYGFGWCMGVSKDDKKKQFAYDSDGNLILVQPPQVHRLPNPNTAPTFVCKQEEVSQEHRVPEKKAARREKGRRRENSVEFKDGFKKFLSQQPSMMEAMVMSPGVELEENHRSKKGEKAKSHKPSTMSRKEYEEMTKGMGGVPEQTVATPIKSVPPRKVSHVCRAHHVKVAPDISQSDISSYTSWMSEGHCAAQGDAGTARADAL
eukprot:g3163.t1